MYPAQRIRAHPVIGYCLSGGLCGALTHIWAVYRGIVTKPPMLRGASPVAAALIFIGALVAAVTYLDAVSLVARAVYWLAFIGLNALSVVSLFTGFKVNFLPFRLCPVIFTTASILILLRIYL